MDGLLPPRQLQFLGVKQFENEERKLKLNFIKDQEGREKGINLREFVD
jgi:hypothetical protein